MVKQAFISKIVPEASCSWLTLTVFSVVPGRTVKPCAVQTGGVTTYDGECSSVICSSLFPVLRTGATTAGLSFQPFPLSRQQGKANLPTLLG